MNILQTHRVLSLLAESGIQYIIEGVTFIHVDLVDRESIKTPCIRPLVYYDIYLLGTTKKFDISKLSQQDKQY